MSRETSSSSIVVSLWQLAERARHSTKWVPFASLASRFIEQHVNATSRERYFAEKGPKAFSFEQMGANGCVSVVHSLAWAATRRFTVRFLHSCEGEGRCGWIPRVSLRPSAHTQLFDEPRYFAADSASSATFSPSTSTSSIFVSSQSFDLCRRRLQLGHPSVTRFIARSWDALAKDTRGAVPHVAFATVACDILQALAIDIAMQLALAAPLLRMLNAAARTLDGVAGGRGEAMAQEAALQRISFHAYVHQVLDVWCETDSVREAAELAKYIYKVIVQGEERRAAMSSSMLNGPDASGALVLQPSRSSPRSGDPQRFAPQEDLDDAEVSEVALVIERATCRAVGAGHCEVLVKGLDVKSLASFSQLSAALLCASLAKAAGATSSPPQHSSSPSFANLHDSSVSSCLGGSKVDDMGDDGDALGYVRLHQLDRICIQGSDFEHHFGPLDARDTDNAVSVSPVITPARAIRGGSVAVPTSACHVRSQLLPQRLDWRWSAISEAQEMVPVSPHLETRLTAALYSGQETVDVDGVDCVSMESLTGSTPPTTFTAVALLWEFSTETVDRQASTNGRQTSSSWRPFPAHLQPLLVGWYDAQLAERYRHPERLYAQGTDRLHVSFDCDMSGFSGRSHQLELSVIVVGGSSAARAPSARSMHTAQNAAGRRSAQLRLVTWNGAAATHRLARCRWLEIKAHPPGAAVVESRPVIEPSMDVFPGQPDGIDVPLSPSPGLPSKVVEPLIHTAVGVNPVVKSLERRFLSSMSSNVAGRTLNWTAEAQAARASGTAAGLPRYAPRRILHSPSPSASRPASRGVVEPTLQVDAAALLLQRPSPLLDRLADEPKDVAQLSTFPSFPRCQRRSQWRTAAIGRQSEGMPGGEPQAPPDVAPPLPRGALDHRQPASRHCSAATGGHARANLQNLKLLYEPSVLGVDFGPAA